MFASSTHPELFRGTKVTMVPIGVHTSYLLCGYRIKNAARGTMWIVFYTHGTPWYGGGIGTSNKNRLVYGLCHTNPTGLVDHGNHVIVTRRPRYWNVANMSNTVRVIHVEMIHHLDPDICWDSVILDWTRSTIWRLRHILRPTIAIIVVRYLRNWSSYIPPSHAI